MSPYRVNRLMTRRMMSVFVTVFAAGVCSTAIAQSFQFTQYDEQAEETLAAELEISVGRSTTLSAPWPVTRVSVAEPAIADLQVVSPEEIMVVGKQPGMTDLMFWGEGDRFWQSRVHVQADVSALAADLKQLFPSADLDVSHRQGTVIVSGQLRRAEEVQHLQQFLDTAGVQHVNMTSVAGVQQVLLRVRVAEASRQAVRAMGVNMMHTGDHFFGGSTIGGNPNGINIGAAEGALAGSSLPFTFNSDTSIGSAVTLFGGFPGSDLQLFVEALVDNQYMRILAEPNLVALSGEQASFLAGGEFPVPVAQSSDAGGGTTITVEFKEFGIRLGFLPTVLGDGTIRLHVAPEVSELSDIGAVENEGFTIPAIRTRRAETTLEMHNGQTFAMAGLMDRSTITRGQSVPGLGSLPVIGSLFRSVRYEQGDTELVVLVTASLVEPMSLATTGPVPGDVHVRPSDWELFVDGRLDAKELPMLGDADAQWMKQLGLHRLTGPGAWSSYGQPPVRLQPQQRLMPAEAAPSTELNEDAAAVEVESEVEEAMPTEEKP